MLSKIDISEQELLEKCPRVLRALLIDRTRTAWELEKKREQSASIPVDFQRNIIWATNSYSEKGDGFGERDEIVVERITGTCQRIVQPRVVKNREIQRQRAKDMAEVFTPSWVCNAQNNLVDDAWFGRPNVFNTESVDESGAHVWTPTEGPVVFGERPSKTSTKSWQDYVRDVRLEITCGEAPYLCSRYDTVDGKQITDMNRRIGLLDRKLRVVTENTKKRADWLKWAKEAVKSVYGFEWQGDNLLLARENVLATVQDHFEARGCRGKGLGEPELLEFAEIISWNLWQMDGLRMVLPYSCEASVKRTPVQMILFDPNPEPETRGCSACAKSELTGHDGIKCLIRDWSKTGDSQIIEFQSLIQKI